MIGRAAQTWWERERLRPDLGRAFRCMVSFMAPLLMSAYGRLPLTNLVFVAIAAQSLATVDVRGPYSLRVTLLLAKSVVLAAAAGLGALVGHSLALSLAAAALIAVGAGYWRRLSTEYGPALAVSSGLLFYIALAYPSGLIPARNHIIAAFIGGCWGLVLQIAFWPFRPEHPLRVAVSDAWLAGANFIAQIEKTDDPPAPRSAKADIPLLGYVVDSALGSLSAPSADHLSAVGSAEAGLRQACDRGNAILDSAAKPGKSAIVDRLRELNRAAARLTLRISAYYGARAAFQARPGDWSESEAPFLTAVQNLARTIAIAVVSRNPAHLATANVRVRRAGYLARGLREKAEVTPGAGPLAEALREIEGNLPEATAALAGTIGRVGERSAFSLELTELAGAPLRSLSLALNFRGAWDRALVRYVARIGILTLAGVAVMKRSHLPHGYWLPFTMILVLQPDYGSTRQKAAQRLLGTLGGSIVASVLLGLKLPWAALMAGVAICCFIFGYFLKRNYALAVVFITVFVVAMTESFAPQTLRLTEERLGSTLAGGLTALVAAFLFWPVWERDRVRPILARGFRANGELIRLSFSAPAGIDQPAVVRARRAAESANAEVFSSLQRMAGDPKDRQDRLEALAAMANGNQRLTRALALALMRDPPPTSPGFAGAAAGALDSLADGFVSGHLENRLADRRTGVTRTAPPALARAAAELSALILEVQEFEFASVPAAQS